MGRAVVTIHSGRRDPSVGLFYTHVDWRTNDVCDLDTWRWSSEAACAGTDPEAWFPSGNANTKTLAIICGECPVRAECLRTALREDMSGWWGGTSEGQRRAIRAAHG